MKIEMIEFINCRFFGTMLHYSEQAGGISDQMNHSIASCLFLLFSISFVIISSSMQVYADSRSDELNEIVVEEGDVERIDYVDDNGVITFAVNKHYATLIKTKSENTVLEEYLDENGHPAKQRLGNYALLREYNNQGQDYRITYLDAEKKPMMIRSGCAIVIREFNDNNKISKETYYDTDEKPVLTLSLGYACRREYDSKGRNNVISYLDQEDHLMICGQGFAEVRKTFYDEGTFEGKVEREFYFNEKEEPIRLSLGQYGSYYEYDEHGRVIVQTYLDADGSPMMTNKGYSTMKCTYHPDNSVETRSYFDLADNPVKLSEGQYSVTYDLNGEETYLDKNGKRIFNLKRLLYHSEELVIVVGVLLILFSALAGKRINLILLVLYTGFILYMTLLYRNRVITTHNFELFRTYKQLLKSHRGARDIINNILLFAPLGTILYRLYHKNSVLLIPFLLTVFIEAFQYFTSIGVCELDDIFNNTLGSVIGYGAGWLIAVIKRKLTKKNQDECI